MKEILDIHLCSMRLFVWKRIGSSAEEGVFGSVGTAGVRLLLTCNTDWSTQLRFVNAEHCSVLNSTILERFLSSTNFEGALKQKSNGLESKKLLGSVTEKHFLLAGYNQ